MEEDLEKSPYYLIGKLDSILNYTPLGCATSDRHRVKRAREVILAFKKLRGMCE